MKETLKDVQSKYNDFLEQFSLVESCLEELSKTTNRYLYEYSKSIHCNDYFAENIEINSLYFDNFLERINSITDDIANINIQYLEEPKINNVVNINNYIHIPDNYDVDIYVDMNNHSDWKDLT